MSRRAAPTRHPLEKFLRGQGHRRWTYTAVTLVVALLLVWADRSGLLLDAGGDMARYDGKTFRVVRVIDGDTLDVDAPDGEYPTTRVRLWGVDTPETAKQDPPRPAEPFADEATELTRKLAVDMQVRLTLEPHRLRGDYGRLLAFVELPDGTLLNEALIRAGLSEADDRWPHRHIERFDAAERDARAEGLGLWGR